MTAELAAAYRDLRVRILDMTADLSPEEAERIVPCCPEWRVRDLLCHLAGVPADILTGNTAEAATVAWADSHVTRRAGWDLDRIRTELDEAGTQVDEVVTAVGERFPGPFFIDAWTHEADLAHALDRPGPSDLRLVDHVLDFLVDSVDRRLAEAGLGPVTVTGLGDDRFIGVGVGAKSGSNTALDGTTLDSRALDGTTLDSRALDGRALDGTATGRAELHTNRFEFARATMGRRSLAQLAALDWRGIDGAVAGPLLVAWTPNDLDIIEDEPRTR